MELSSIEFAGNAAGAEWKKDAHTSSLGFKDLTAAIAASPNCSGLDEDFQDLLAASYRKCHGGHV